MNALTELQNKPIDELTDLEDAILLMWVELDGYEHIADKAATELAALLARVGELERELDEYKRLTGGKTTQEFNEWLDVVSKNTSEAARQSAENLAKMKSIVAALGAK